MKNAMHRLRPQLLLLPLLFNALPVAAEEQNWPGWRGADRTDIAQETGLLKSWPEDGPEQLWVVENVGLGYAGHAIVDSKLFTMGSLDGIASLICLNAETGEEIWVTEIAGQFNNGWGDGPRSTPSVADGKVYALAPKGDLVCVDAANGDLHWKKNIAKDFDGKVPNWGFSASPLIDGDKLIVTPGGKDGTVVALDRHSGDVLWEAAIEINKDAHYSSAIVAEHNGVRQYIQLFPSKVVGLAAEDGSLLWESEWQGKTAVIPTPIYHDGHVFITSGYGIGHKLIKLSEQGAEDIYQGKELVNHHGGVILFDGYLYGHSDKGGWTCLDFKSGDVKWAEMAQLGKGACHIADGMLYLLGEKDGAVVLAEASPKGYEEKGRFVLDPQTTQRAEKGKIWTHPVVCNGKLYLRDQEYLHCYDVSGN